ncbi:MAG: hypothetical protein WCC81_07650 [Pseudolabrys sp.]
MNFKIFISGDALDNSTFLDKQLELARLIGVFGISIKAGREIDASGRHPVPLYDALVR